VNFDITDPQYSPPPSPPDDEPPKLNFPPMAQLREALVRGATVVDIRPPISSEAVDGKLTFIRGALSAPFDREKGTMPLSALGGLPFDAPLVLHCRSGGRVAKAEALLRDAGYTDVLNGGGPQGPAELWQTLCDERGVHAHVMPTFIQLFDEGNSSTLTYILADEASKEAIIIDPVLEQVERDLAEVEKLGCKLTLALNTHCHADHITGTGSLKAKVPGLRSLISKASGAKADELLTPHQRITWAGGKRSLLVLPTPGHTSGCVSYFESEAGAIFTGDLVLIGGCGRTDFQEGNAALLYDSVQSQVFVLPDDTIIYPAHDYKGRRATTVGEEKRSNPRLTKPKAEFVELMANLSLPYPKKIDEALPANLVCGIVD